MKEKVWFTSDLHFNHDKDFIWEARGYSSIKEMNKDVVRKYNEVISDEDTVYILGDCLMGKLDDGIDIMKSLKGKKYLAYGNHDTNNKLKFYLKHNFFEDIQSGYRIKHKGRNFLLTHYPTITKNKHSSTDINLFGHTHQKHIFYNDLPFMMNIGLDAHDCYPIELEELIKHYNQYKTTLSEEKGQI